MKKISHINKGNLWYPPTKSLYTFLTCLEKSGLPKTLAVLGCADGNYVIPAVKRGFRVLAIDIDVIALYGGQAHIGDKDFKITGMKKKLERLGLEKMVTIVNQSYLEYQPEKTFSGVIVSESTHYRSNSIYSLDKIIRKIQSYVSVSGLLFFEHIHVSRKNSDVKRFLTSDRLISFFKTSKWIVTSNKNKVYLEEPNLKNNRIHEIVLGRLYALKLAP